MKMRYTIRERATAIALAAVMAFSPVSYSSAFAGETEATTEQEMLTEAPQTESTEPATETASLPETQSALSETSASQDAPAVSQSESPAAQAESTASGTETAQGEQAQEPYQEESLDINGLDSLSARTGAWNVSAFMANGTPFPEGSVITAQRLRDVIGQELSSEGFSEGTQEWESALDERTSALKAEVLGAKNSALWDAWQKANGTDASLKDAWISQKKASGIFDRVLKITVTDPDGNEFPEGSVDLIVSVKDDDLYNEVVKNGGYTGEFSFCEPADRADGGKGYQAELYGGDALMYGDILMDGTVSVMLPGAKSGFHTFSFYKENFTFDPNADTAQNEADAEETENPDVAALEQAGEDVQAENTGVSAQEDMFEMKASVNDAVVTVSMEDGSMIPAGSVLKVEKAEDEAFSSSALALMWEKYAEQNGLDASDEYYRDAFVSQKKEACDLASSYLVTLTSPDGTVMQDGLTVIAEFKNDSLYAKTANEGERYELVTFASTDGSVPGAEAPELHDTEAFTYGYFAENSTACIRLDGAGSAVYSVFAVNPSWAFELPPEDGRPAPETELETVETETEAVTESPEETETEAETEEMAVASSARAQAGDMTVTVKKTDGTDLPEGTSVEITTEKGMSSGQAAEAKDTAAHKWAVDLRDSIDYMRFQWDKSAEDTAARFYKEETSEIKAVRLSVRDADGKEIDEDLLVSFGFNPGSGTGQDCLNGKLDMFRLSEDGSSAEADYEAGYEEKDGEVVVSTAGNANRTFVFAGSVNRLDFGVTEYAEFNISEPDNTDVADQIRENREESGGYDMPVLNADLSDLGDRYTDEEIEALFKRGISDDGIADVDEEAVKAGSSSAPAESSAVSSEEQEEESGQAMLETEESIRTASAETADEEEFSFAPAVSAKAASAAFDDNLETNKFSLENGGRIHSSSYGWSGGASGAGTSNFMLKVNGRYYDIYCIEPRVSGNVSDSGNKKIVKPLTSTTSARQIQLRKVLFWCSPAKRGLNGEIKKGAYWSSHHTDLSYNARYLLVHFALAYVNGKAITGSFFNAMNSKGANICYDMIDWANRHEDPLNYGYVNFYKIESGVDGIQDGATMTAKSATPVDPPAPYKRVSNVYSEASLGPSGTVSNDLGTYGTEYYYRIAQPVGAQPGSAEVTSMVFTDTLPQGIKMVPGTWSVTTSDGRNLTGAFRMTTGMSGIRQTLRVTSTGSLGAGFTNVTINLNFRATLSRDDIYDNTDNSSSKYTKNFDAGRIDYTVYNYANTAISITGGGKTVNGGGTTNRVTTTANSIAKGPEIYKRVHPGKVYSGSWELSSWTDTINDPFQYMLRIAIPKNDRVFMMKTFRISDTLPHGIDGAYVPDENGQPTSEPSITVYEVQSNNNWVNVSSKYTIVLSDEDEDDNQSITITRNMTPADRIDDSAKDLRVIVDCNWDRVECAKYRLKKNVVNPDGSINVFYGPDTNNEGQDARVLNHFYLDTTFSNIAGTMFSNMEPKVEDNKIISNEVRVQTKAIIPSANTTHIEPSVEKYVKAVDSDSEWKLITETVDPGEYFRYKLVVDTRQTEIPETTSDASDHTLTAGDLSKVRDCFDSDIRLDLTSGDVVVPEYAVIGGKLVRITAIADSIFKGNTTITSVKLPDSVQSIGASAFEGCTKLRSVNIPAKLTSLGARAFYGCSELRAGGGVMFIPGAVGTIKTGTFYGCRDFTVAICEGITSVEAGAFENTRWMGIHVTEGCTMDANALRGSNETVIAFHTAEDMSEYTGGGTDTESASGMIDTQETYTSMEITDVLPEGCRLVSTVDAGPFSITCDDGRNLTATSTEINTESVYEIELECEWVPDDCRKSGNLRFDRDDKIYYYGPLYNNFMLDYHKDSKINETVTDVEDSKKSNTVSVKTKEFQPVQTDPQKWIDMDGAIETRDDLETLKVIHDLYDPTDNTVTFVIRQEIPRTYAWSLRDIRIYDPIINKLDISEISFSYDSAVTDPEYGTWKEEDGELDKRTTKRVDGKSWSLSISTRNEIDIMNLSSLSGDIQSRKGVTAELRIVSSIESARNALDGTYNWEWENDPDLPKGSHAYWTMRGSQAVARIPNRAKTTVIYQCPDDYPYTEYEKETQTVWVEAQLPTANIILDKKNQYDESVLDATFAVYEWNNPESKYDEQAVAYLTYNSQTQKYTLPENVYLKRDGYNQGKFKIEEIITPDGYEKAANTDHTPFSGEVEIAAGETDLQEINVNVYEEYLGMNVEILKLIEGSDEDGAEGIPLEGAVFEIYAKEDITTPEGHVIYRNDGVPIETGITTGADGKAVSTLKYYPGKYQMIETEAPRDPATGKPYGMAGPQDFEVVSADGKCVLVWGGVENNFITQLSGTTGQTLNLDLSEAEDYVDYGFTAENFLGSMISTVPMKYRLTVDISQPIDQGLSVVLLDSSGAELSRVWMESGSIRSSGSVKTTLMYGTTTPRIMYESDSFVFAGAGTKMRTPYTVRVEGDEAKVFFDYLMNPNPGEDREKQAYKIKISIDGSVADIEGSEAKIYDPPQEILFPVVRKYINDADENDWKSFTHRYEKTEYERPVLYKLHSTFYKNEPDRVTQSAVITDTIPQGLNFTGEWHATMGGRDVTENLELAANGQNLTFTAKTKEFAESLEGSGELYSSNDMDIILYCKWNRDEYDPSLLVGTLKSEVPYSYSDIYGPIDNKYALYTTYLSGEDHNVESNIVRAEIEAENILYPTLEKWIMDGSTKLTDRTFAEWDAIIPYRIELTTEGDWTGRFTPTLIRIQDVYEEGLTYAKTDDTFAVEIDGETVATWSYDEIVEPDDPTASTVKNGWNVSVDGNTMYVTTSDPEAIQNALNKEVAVLTNMTLSENETKLEKYWTDETHLTVPNKASDFISFEKDGLDSGDNPNPVMTPPDIEQETQTVTANFEIDSVNLEIFKTDSLTGDPVKDAEFTVYEWNTALADGAGAYDTRTVAEGGKEPIVMTYDDTKGCYTVPAGRKLFVKSTNLGKFKAVETKVPEGYAGSIEREFTKDDAVGRMVTLNLVNEPASVRLNMQKFDATDGTTPVAGAVYELKPDEIIRTPGGKTVKIPLQEGGTLDYIAGETIDTLTTDAEGKATSTVDLYPGKYILQEISAPAPYKVSRDPIRFSVVVDEEGQAHTVFTDTLHPEDKEGDDVEYTDLVKAYDEPPIEYPNLVKYVYADNAGRNESGDWDLYHWTEDLKSTFKYKLQVKIPENIEATKMNSFVLTDALEEGADIVSLDRITTKKFENKTDGIDADELWAQEDQALTGFNSIPVKIVFDDDDDADGTRQAAINAAKTDGSLKIGLEKVTIAGSGDEAVTEKTPLTKQEVTGDPLSTTFSTWTKYNEYILTRYEGENLYDVNGDTALIADTYPSVNGGLWGDAYAFLKSPEIQAIAPADESMQGNPKYIVYTGVSSEDGSGGTIAGYIDYIEPEDGDTQGVIHLFGNGSLEDTVGEGSGYIRIVQVDGVNFDDSSKSVLVPDGTESVSRNTTYTVVPPELDGYTWTVSRKGRSVTVTYSKAGKEKDASSMFTASTSGDVLKLTAKGDVSKLEGNILYVYMTVRWDETEAKNAGHYTGQSNGALTGLRYYHLNNFDISTAYRSGHTFRKTSNQVKVETWKSLKLPSFTIKKYITEGGTDFKATDDDHPEAEPYFYDGHPDGVPYRIDTMIDKLDDPIAAFESFMITDRFVDALEITGATAVVNGKRTAWTKEEFGTEKEISGKPFILEVAGQDITLSAPEGLPLDVYGKKVSLEVQTHIRDDNGADPFLNPYYYEGFLPSGGTTRTVYRDKAYRVTKDFHTEISFPNISQASAMFGKTLDGDRIGNPINRLSNEVWAKFRYDFKLKIDKKQADWENPSVAAMDGGEPVRVPGAEFEVHPYSDSEGKYLDDVVAALEWNDTAKRYVMADNSWLFKTGDNVNGKFLIEEYVTPEGYKQARDIEFTLSDDNTDGEEDCTINIEILEELARMNLQVYKIDENTKGDEVGNIPVEGAVYGIFAREDIASKTRDEDVISIIYPAGTVIDVVTTGPSGRVESEEGSSGSYTYHDLESGTDKTLEYENKGYYPGKYYVAELTAPEGYDLDVGRDGTPTQHNFEVTTNTRHSSGTNVALSYDPTGGNNINNYVDADSDGNPYDLRNGDGIGTIMVSDTPSTAKIKIRKTIDRIEDVRWPENGKITFEFLIRGTALSGEKIDLTRAITFIKSDYTGRTGPVTLEKEITDLPVGDYRVIELRRNHFKLDSLAVEVQNTDDTASKTYSPTRGTTSTSIPSQVTFTGGLKVKFYDESTTGRPARVKVKVYHPKTGGGSEVYAEQTMTLNASGEGTATVSVAGGQLADAWIEPQEVAGYKWYYTHNSTNGFDITYVADNSEFGGISAEDEYAIFELHTENASGTATFTNTKRNDEWYLHVKKANANGDPLKNVNFSIFSDNALTRVVATGSTDTTGEYVSPMLQEGIYYLEETKSAAGYSLLANAIEMKAESGTDSLVLRINGEVVGSDTSKPIYAQMDGDGYYHLYLNVVNQEGFTLPMTGAPLQVGLIILVIGITAAGVILIRRKKKKKTA